MNIMQQELQEMMGSPRTQTGNVAKVVLIVAALITMGFGGFYLFKGPSLNTSTKNQSRVVAKLSNDRYDNKEVRNIIDKDGYYIFARDVPNPVPIPFRFYLDPDQTNFTVKNSSPLAVRIVGHIEVLQPGQGVSQLLFSEWNLAIPVRNGPPDKTSGIKTLPITKNGANIYDFDIILNSKELADPVKEKYEDQSEFLFYIIDKDKKIYPVGGTITPSGDHQNLVNVGFDTDKIDPSNYYGVDTHKPYTDKGVSYIHGVLQYTVRIGKVVMSCRKEQVSKGLRYFISTCERDPVLSN